MDIKRTQELVEKFIENRATSAEESELMSWYRSANETELQWLDQSEATRLRMLSAINQQIQPQSIRRIWPRIAAAASILLVLSAGSYFILHKEKPQQTATVQKIDIAPGNQGATLQLSNGQQISLNSVKVGNIAQQGNTNISKTTDNKIVYNSTAPASELIYNIITTKRGNFYPLTLSDGTVAILDAASSIKYPVAFTGNERKVEITGQVYFEVKHNAKMPFRVVANGQTFEDLGTSFNINAYNDEPNVKATLIEGSIRVNDQNILTPGQQAVITSGHIKVGKADIEQAVAWKNGSFNFDNTPMDEAMRQISRWYDVDIEYPNGMPKTVFNGGMYRNMKASQVLEILSFFKVHFEIVQGSDGKKIVVKP